MAYSLDQAIVFGGAGLSRISKNLTKAEAQLMAAKDDLYSMYRDTPYGSQERDELSELDKQLDEIRKQLVKAKADVVSGAMRTQGM